MNSFKGYPIISEQVGAGELTVIWRELEKMLDANVPGDIAEFGCYIGTSSLFIRRLLDRKGQSARREFHVYDSFAGLPPKGLQDASPVGTDFKAGELNISKKELLRQFHAAHLQPPVVHKGWFNQLTDADVPPKLAFAFLDGDFYQSIMDPLKLIWPLMSPGAVILVDDYQREALPGPTKAIEQFLQGKSVKIQTQNNIGIIKINANLQNR